MKEMLLPVDMVARFTLEGVPTPLKYRMATEGEINQAIPVEWITERREEKTKGGRMLSFKCRSTVDGVEQSYDLRYDVGTCCWFLNRPG